MTNLPYFNIPSIDIYITSRCGLRCSHCFVGEDLNKNINFDFDLLKQLLATAKSWNTTEITFLGGEPTLYPQIIEAVNLSNELGFNTRIVTNGHTSFLKFLEKFANERLPFICFSIDGSNEQIHDLVRGKGSFGKLMQSIEISGTKGYRKAAIISISKQNADDIEQLLKVCDILNFEYINIHYVTNRGFASKDIVLTIEEWKSVYQKIEEISKQIRPKIRIERTFVPNVNQHLKCAVIDKSNLMFYPDTRVYMCMMFIDLPNSHSFNWTNEGLIPNQSLLSEQNMAKSITQNGCPAISFVNQFIADETIKRNEFVQCIYEKEDLI
jgi:MoaA/NifB/PqqE/SkfB family radical SAM enzyme